VFSSDSMVEVKGGFKSEERVRRGKGNRGSGGRFYSGGKAKKQKEGECSLVDIQKREKGGKKAKKFCFRGCQQD